MDLPDVVQVVQFGVTMSLSMKKQRRGRAGRNREAARFILLVEPSVFQMQKARKAKAKAKSSKTVGAMTADLDEIAGKIERKKVEKGLRDYIETGGCRRDVSDAYFKNPPRDPRLEGAARCFSFRYVI